MRQKAAAIGQGPPIVAGTGTLIHDATVDFDGNVWFTDPYSPIPGRTVGKIDGVTGEMKPFAIPGDAPGSTARSHAIITARDGTIWFNVMMVGKGGADPIADGGLGCIDPRTNETKLYRVPKGMPGVGGWINEDGHGNIWTSAGGYRGGEGAWLFDRKTRQFRQFRSLREGMTYGVAGDASGNGWWAQINNDVVGYVELPAGKVGELQIPFSWQGAPFLKPGDMSEQEYFETSVGVGGVRGGAQMPRRLKGDLNGDDVWVANYSGNNLMRINSTSKKTTYYPAPEFGMAVYDVGIDHLHRVWVGLQNGDEIPASSTRIRAPGPSIRCRPGCECSQPCGGRVEGGPKS
ncbi:MAG: hypothetical protein IPJ97_13335 [Proteobacteria bacterium]|nr:hypothetical protein [Pseudomonadota bacterium]